MQDVTEIMEVMKYGSNEMMEFMNISKQFGQGYQHILGSKNQIRKIDEIHKDFELYRIFMYNFCGKLS